MVDTPDGDRRRSRLAGTLLAGVLAGLLAWIGGYAASYALVAPEIAGSPLHRVIEMLGGRPPTAVTVGWLFFNVHFVDVVIRSVPRVGRLSLSFVGGDAPFTLALYAIPVVALGVGGGAVARVRSQAIGTRSDSAHDRRRAIGRGFAAGATVLAGYLPASAVAPLLLTFTTGQAVAAPHFPSAILLSGVVYPVAFGGLGGAAAAAVESRRSGRT